MPVLSAYDTHSRRLPNEIIGMIAAQVYALDDSKAWSGSQTFRLVARTFNKSISPLLFQAVEFGNNSEPCSVTHLQHFLEYICPAQSRFVRHCRVYIPFSSADPSQHGITYIETLAKCLDALPQLVYLHLLFVTQQAHPHRSSRETAVVPYSAWAPVARAVCRMTALKMLDATYDYKEPQNSESVSDIVVCGLTTLTQLPTLRCLNLSFVTPAARDIMGVEAHDLDLNQNSLKCLRITSISSCLINRPYDIIADGPHFLVLSELPWSLRELNLGTVCTKSIDLYRLLSSVSGTLQKLMLSYSFIFQHPTADKQLLKSLPMPHLTHCGITSCHILPFIDASQNILQILNMLRLLITLKTTHLGLCHQPLHSLDVLQEFLAEPQCKNIIMFRYSLERDPTLPSTIPEESALFKYCSTRKVALPSSDQAWMQAWEHTDGEPSEWTRW